MSAKTIDGRTFIVYRDRDGIILRVIEELPEYDQVMLVVPGPQGASVQIGDRLVPVKEIG